MAFNTGSNPYEVELLTAQYTPLLDLLLQQRTSKIRGACTTGMHVGKMASPIQQVGVLEAKAPAGRYAPIVPQVPQYTRRWVFPNDRELAVFLDTFDELRTIVDPKSGINEAAVAAYNRFFDDLLIAAALASASTGVDASSLTTETFATTASTSGGYLVADTFGASASTGMTYPKLVEAFRVMQHAQVDMDGDSPAVIMGSLQLDDLKKQQEVISKEYNAGAAVVNEGTVSRLAGFNLMTSERLATSSSNSLRNCIAFARSGLYLGVWKDLSVRIDNRLDLSSQPWQLYSMASAGATRTQLFKIVQINCADTSGADPTAP